MAKKYTTQEILDMAVGLIEEDLAADYNGDGKVTVKDARYSIRESNGLRGDESPVMAQNVLDKLINRTGSFSYDVSGDPLYRKYRDMYRSEGKTAAEDILGLSASLTGGWGNSYGTKAAQSVYGQYMKKADEKADELEKQAYDRYRDETDSLISLYKILSDNEEEYFDRQEQKEDSFRDLAFKAADAGDYSLLESLGIDISALKGDEEWKMAELLAKYSDYSGLKDLGVDLSGLGNKELIEAGKLFASYGDYTLLRLLGVNTDRLDYKELLDTAEIFASYGDYSLLKLLGVDTSEKEELSLLEKLILKNRSEKEV